MLELNSLNVWKLNSKLKLHKKLGYSVIYRNYTYIAYIINWILVFEHHQNKTDRVCLKNLRSRLKVHFSAFNYELMWGKIKFF